MSLVAYSNGLLIADRAILVGGGADMVISSTKVHVGKSIVAAVAGGLVDEQDEGLFLASCALLMNRFEKKGVFQINETSRIILGLEDRTVYLMTKRNAYILDAGGLRTLRKKAVYAHGTGATAFLALHQANVEPTLAVRCISEMTPTVSRDCYVFRTSDFQPFTFSEDLQNAADIHL